MRKLLWCECLADLCDGEAQGLGTWADLWIEPATGELFASMGGGWDYYDETEGLPESFFLISGDGMENLVRHWQVEDGAHFPPFSLFAGDFVAASGFELVTDYDFWD